jgi:hypothetical protein
MAQNATSSQARHGRAGLVSVLVLALLFGALLIRQTGSTWAQPNQSGLHQSIPTAASTPTAGPTATRTTTPGAGVYRVILQQGLDSYTGTSDTYITAYTKDSPVTDRSRLKLKGPDTMSPLVRFDLTGKLPAGAYVLQAELVFYVEGGERVRTLDVGAFRVLQAWDAAWVTWNSRMSGVLWGCRAATRPAWTVLRRQIRIAHCSTARSTMASTSPTACATFSSRPTKTMAG